jgi:uncharacterized membrane protein YkvA (DUF1232 family)
VITQKTKIVLRELVEKRSGGFELSVSEISIKLDLFIRSSELAASDHRFRQNLLEILNAARRELKPLERSILLAVICLVVERAPAMQLTKAEKVYLADRYVKESNRDNSSKRPGISGQLSMREREAALSLLEELGNNKINTDIVISHAAEILADFNDSWIGFAGRFRRDLEVIVSAFQQSSNKKYERTLAAGALMYLLEDDDVIQDHLGYIGLLDDMYVARQAASVIDPELGALTNDVENLLFELPFMKDFHLQSKGDKYTYRLSDYALQSFAPLARSLQKNCETRDDFRCYFNTSQTSAQVCLYGYLAALVNIEANCQVPEEGMSLSFKPGEKVLIDFSNVVVFEGLNEIGGQNFLKLRSERKEAGQVLHTWQHLNLSQLGRIQPCNQDRVARGFSSTDINAKNIRLSAIEQLFGIQAPPVFSLLRRRVFIVTNKKDWDDFCGGTFMYGEPLSRTIPLARIKRNGEIETVSPGVREDHCLLYVAHDLESITEKVMEGFVREGDTLLVDGQGQMAMLYTLDQFLDFKLSIMILGDSLDDQTAQGLLLNRFTFFDWPNSLVHRILPVDKTKRSDAFGWEHSLTVQSQAKIEDVVIVSSEADKFFEIFQRMTSEFSKCGPNESVSILHDRLIGLSLRSLSSNSLVSPEINVNELLDETRRLQKEIISDQYLPEGILAVAAELLEFWLVSGSSLIGQRDTAIKDVLKASANIRVTLVAPKWFKKGKLNENWLYLRDLRIKGPEGRIIIPFWPSKKTAHEILHLGVATKVIFLLFAGEAKWLKLFKASQGLPKNTHSAITPEYSHLIKNDFVTDAGNLADESLPDNDRAEIERKLSAVDTVLNRANHDLQALAEVNYCFILDPDASVFATDRSHFTVVVRQGDEYKVNEKYGYQIRQGDLLLFSPHADGSLIRVEADLILPKGTRQSARKWQEFLNAGLLRINGDHSLLKTLLYKAGIDRHEHTITNWLHGDTIIAPRNYDKVLPVLFEILDISNHELVGIISAIREVYSIQQKVARELSDKVKKNILSNNKHASDLQVFYVEHIESVSRKIPYSFISRPVAL